MLDVVVAVTMKFVADNDSLCGFMKRMEGPSSFIASCDGESQGFFCVRGVGGKDLF